MTIGDVARRSRLTVATVKGLEDFHNRNPSFDTVFRYAMAMDRLVILGTEEIEPDIEDAPEVSDATSVRDFTA